MAEEGGESKVQEEETAEEKQPEVNEDEAAGNNAVVESKKPDQGEGDQEESKLQESKESDNENKLIVFKFIIHPGGFPHLLSVEKNATVQFVRESLADDLQLPAEAITFDKGSELDGKTDLSHLEAGNQQYQVKVIIEKDIAEMASTYKMPSQIEVVIRNENEDEEDGDDYNTRTIIVNIEREDLEHKKPYLGGYRDKRTGVEYHHACTQRYADKKASSTPATTKYTRETQTAVEISRSAQTLREAGTQMARPDLYIDSKNDRNIDAKDYFDSAQQHALRVSSTLVIQRYWRGYVARSRAYNIRCAQQERLEEQQRLRDQRIEEEKQQHEREVQRRMNPRTRADFEILYNELEHWRQHETTRIKSLPDITEVQKQKMLEELLHKETKLLQTIDRLKLEANEKNREKRIKKLLEAMASPKSWQMQDGDIVLTHTPFTTRAKELLDLYEGLQLKGTSIDERLDILLHVKWSCKEFDCDLTRDIVDLIDREADLLNRGRSEKTMYGLRKRIATLFLQFVNTPAFNPEAARFQQVPSDLIQRPQIIPK